MVSFIQIITSAVAILIYKFLCGGNSVDGFEWNKMKAYSMYIVAFVAAIYANMQALANSNVETVIVFRACSPISVTIVEYFLMDRGKLTEDYIIVDIRIQNLLYTTDFVPYYFILISIQSNFIKYFSPFSVAQHSHNDIATLSGIWCANVLS